MLRLVSNPAAFGVAVFAVFLVFTGTYFKGRYDGKMLERGVAAVAAAKAEGRIAELERNAERITKESENEWSGKVRELEARVATLSAVDLEPIRLCGPPSSRRRPEAPTASPQPDGTPVAGGSDLQAGKDIREDLLVYARDCEKWRGQLIGLQLWESNQAALED